MCASQNTPLKIFIFCLFFFFIGAFLNAQSVKGKVTDSNTGEPLVGATVKLQGTKYTALVKLNGMFNFPAVAPGTYQVLVTYLGYKPVNNSSTVTVAGTENKVVNFSLEPQATELQSVTITAPSASETDGNARRL
ncbi:MAG: carboxypeptidase-like regulatory domain-containing protein [Aquabacterium sp.]|nr:carboxypeptidase-like regulatory domain-containing protein [Ferruginibacter sp.]